MDYKKLVDELEDYFDIYTDLHPAIFDEAATAITDLLARAEAAEARAEKAERERDAAVKDLKDEVMGTWFNTQIGPEEYKLQFSTENKAYFNLVQSAARHCVDGIVKREEDDACTELPELCFMINLPERMEKKPFWTEQEVQDAKTILRMFGADNFTHVTKDQDGWPSIMDGDGKDPNTGWCSIGMEKDMFPSLKPGQTITLFEIIGGAE